MKDVYAALLLHAAGQPINEENVEKVLKAAGVTEDKTKIKAICVALDGVNVEEAIAKAAVVHAAPAASAEGEKEEEVVDEKSEEEKEAEASAGLANLFG
jgi:large subunit ribosomal protein L12